MENPKPRWEKPSTKILVKRMENGDQPWSENPGILIKKSSKNERRKKFLESGRNLVWEMEAHQNRVNPKNALVEEKF